MEKTENNITPSSIYLMHKYWGKKPASELKNIVEKYTKEGDVILDPFAGYGGIGVEGILLNRNVILNDLNPVANYISKCILETSIDINKLKMEFKKIKEKYKEQEKRWYTYKGFEIITILRNKEDIPLKLKVKNDEKKLVEIELKQKEREEFIKAEQEYIIKEWYPTDKLIKNSRIGAKGNMKVSDLFPKRALICQAYLYEQINLLENSKEKDMLLFAFSSNLANCSKLVPPILSRGEMAQGAWMTGFYVGEKYLENNVFHYFENRVNKVIKGKTDYLKIYNSSNKNCTYKITNYDAKDLKIESEKVDFIFTDFPYGDTVPYFEQSQLWNAWLKNNVDYENEIVISDSNERNKNIESFSNDIEKAITEICRVLKNKSFFVFTFHSIQGEEWNAIANAIAKNNLKFIDCTLLTQKTLPPRQLNRKVTVKGDLVVVYQKVKKVNNKLDTENVMKVILSEIRKECKLEELYDTNELIIICVRTLLKLNVVSDKIDFIQIINDNFQIDEKNNKKWRLKNEV